MSNSQQISRRTFLAGSAAAMTGGLVITYQLGTRLPSAEPLVAPHAPREPIGPPGTLNAYIHIRPDDRVVLRVPEIEMGQGVTTALAQVLADELRARWAQVIVEAPPIAGGEAAPLTRDSTSVREGYGALRRAAAKGRHMLIGAAAAHWSVPTEQCEASEGRVHHRATQRSLAFGALADGASRQPPPMEPLLLPTDQNTLVGRSLARVDGQAQLDGALMYGIDFRLPGMKVAQVEHPPRVGAELVRFDAAAARSVPGVIDVFAMPSGVAVLAEHTWAAEMGRRTLDVEWSGPKVRFDERGLDARLVGAIGDAKTVVERGDLSKITGARRISAEYRVPFVAHVPLEPLNCTAHARTDACDVWVGTQDPRQVIAAAAEVTGLPADRVRVHSVAIGGSFGRRLTTDYVTEALLISRRAGRPVKLVWSRRDDLAGGYYRPMALHRLEGHLTRDGRLVGWSHAIASVEEALPDGLGLAYGIDNIRLAHAPVALPVSGGPWRSGAHSHVAFAVECFVDELAAAARVDPVEFRTKLLRAKPRALRVLEAAVEAAGYGRELPVGHAHGAAIYEAFGSVVAQVAEVSVVSGRPRVHKVTCAVDCGRAVNPDGVKAQIEGGVAFGLSAALYGRVRFRDGAVQQGNFHEYRVLRLKEMPEVNVRLVASESALGGAGEPGVPPIAPAVANAMRQLTRRRVSRLPLVG